MVNDLIEKYKAIGGIEPFIMKEKRNMLCAMLGCLVGVVIELVALINGSSKLTMIALVVPMITLIYFWINNRGTKSECEQKNQNVNAEIKSVIVKEMGDKSGHIDGVASFYVVDELKQEIRFWGMIKDSRQILSLGVPIFFAIIGIFSAYCNNSNIKDLFLVQAFSILIVIFGWLLIVICEVVFNKKIYIYEGLISSIKKVYLEQIMNDMELNVDSNGEAIQSVKDK